MNIFLSHASEQSSEADRLALALRARGHKVFLDRDDLPPGGDYQSRIERAIAECNLFCFLISPHSIANGSFTLSELGFARRRWPNPAGRVLPIIVAKVPIESVPAYLRAVSILEPEGDFVADALGGIERLRPRRSRSWIAAAGAAGVAVVLIAASYYAFHVRNSPPLAPNTKPSDLSQPEVKPPPSSKLHVPAVDAVQDATNRFIAYLKGLGFSNLDENVAVYLYSKERPLPGDMRDQSDVVNAFYRDNGLYIHWAMSGDMTVVLREYTHHVLLGTAGLNAAIGNSDVENGLADYFPASFLGNPLIGEGLGGLFHLSTSYIRKLDNDLTYTSVRDEPHARGEVWAGAWWTCRQAVGQGSVDNVLAQAWRSTMRATSPSKFGARFGAVIASAAAPAGPCLGQEIRRRRLPREA